MDLRFSAHDETFRKDVRRFFEADYPEEIIQKVRRGCVLAKHDYVRSQQSLQRRGWFAAGWPKKFGGPGWSAAERYIFEQELERAGAPWVIPMGVIYVGPVIYTFGTGEQQARWLPGILDSTTFWAQGYSEAEAGSDLASLRLTARREGADYVLNGSKLWTSYAQYADWIFLLVRTSQGARKQEGITFICAEMDAPGISVQPIISLDGVHHLNRVDFENVRVPIDNRIGDEGQGWRYANFLLANERVSYAHVARKREDLRTIRGIAERLPSGVGLPMIADSAFMRRVAGLEVRVDLLEVAVLRLLADGAYSSQAQASALKIQATELAQAIAELFVTLAGPASGMGADRHLENWAEAMDETQAFAPPAMADYLFQRAQTIYGGTTEIQKGIIWKMISASNG